MLWQVESIVEDEGKGKLVAQAYPSGRFGGEGLQAFLEDKGFPIVSFADWLKIHATEVALGSRKGKPQEKIISREDMLTIAKKVSS